jgi:polar amino acid transport system substrate-binding protein
MRALKIIFLVYLTIVFLSNDAFAEKMVKVGGYNFEPFVYLDKGMKAKGLTLELIALLNKHQTDFHFDFVPTTAQRRYRDFEEELFDMMFFENPNWEWLKLGLPIEASATFLEGGEIFIARKKPGRSQNFFKKIEGKRIAGMRGYHYGFANFNAEPTFLIKNHNMMLLDHNGQSIKMVLRERVDLAVVTKMYLTRYLKTNADAHRQILVSQRLDQTYAHRVITRRSSTPSAKYMEQLLKRLEGIHINERRPGPLSKLWQRWGVTQ